MATTIMNASTSTHPWEARRDLDDHLDPHGMAKVIASLGRINLARSNRSAPDWTLVDTPQAVSNLVDIICLEVFPPPTRDDGDASKSSQVPALYIDLQLIDNHHIPSTPHHLVQEDYDQTGPGDISLMQIYLFPREGPGHIYLLDVLTLGEKAAFDTPRSVDLDLERLYAGGPSRSEEQITLKTLLESPTVPKVFFDVRTDAEVLYHRYGISLGGVQDLQLMELAARAVCPSGSSSAMMPLPSCMSPSSPPSLGATAAVIRRSSRSRSGSVTPPPMRQHQHQAAQFPLSPPATPTSRSITTSTCSSVETSPSSTCSTGSFGSDTSASTTTTVSSTTTTTTTAAAGEPSKTTTTTTTTQNVLPRPRRRSLRNLNNLPRCVARDLNLSMAEQMAWERWMNVQRQREQVGIANRELERLNRLMFSNPSVEHDGADQEEEKRSGGGGGNTVIMEGYRLLSVDGANNICARPLLRNFHGDLIGLVVLNVRYLPLLWAEYDRRMRSASGEGDGCSSAVETELLRGREQVWRKRLEEETGRRLELARTGEGYYHSARSGLFGGGSGGGGNGGSGGNSVVKGRGRLSMMAPVGWD